MEKRRQERQEARMGGYGMEKERQEIRLNKFLSESGFCSRREADRLIEAGKVLVDGAVASMGMKIREGQQIEADGTLISGKDRPVVLLVNKPRGIVCTTSDRDRAENIVDFIGYPLRVYPVGRLDKDSEGLILMTNQGELVNRILKGRYGHEKEYLVSVDREITEQFLNRMRKGVKILDTVTRPCTVEKTGEKSFRIILTQGLNRQIRRMCEALGYRVRTLKRVRIMNLRLDGLKTGEYREITRGEWKELTELLEGKGERRKADQKNAEKHSELGQREPEKGGR